MRPLDASTAAHLRPARGALLGLLAASVAQCLFVIGQAFAVAAVIVGVVDGRLDRPAVIALVAVTAGRALSGLVVDRCAARASARVGEALRDRLLAQCVGRGPVWLGQRRSGELVALATRGITAIEPYLTRYLPALVTAAVLPVLALLAMASQDLAAAGIVVATLPLMPLFAALVGMATRDRAERQWRTMATLAGHFLDVVRGLPTLVTYRRADKQGEVVRAATHAHRRASLATLRLAFASSAVLELVATLSVALVAVSVGLRLDSGGLGLRTALVVLLLAPEAYWPLRRVGAEFHAAAEGTATFAAVSELLADGEDAPDPDAASPAAPSPASPAASSATTVRVPDAPGITLSAVTVHYPGSASPALSVPRMTVRARRLTVLTGPSGCGKSTLLLSLLRFVEPLAGRIEVAGQSLAGLDAQGWRAQVSWAPQRPWFTPGTIADNVRLGRPDASDDEVWAALRELDLADAVGALPDGIDTDLSEDGRSLSAGQRARVALARVLVADRPLVLLDEPTAHLDHGSQETVVRALRRLASRATVLVVSHRDELIDAADDVLWLAPPRRERRPAPVAAASAHPSTGPEPVSAASAVDADDDRHGPRVWRRASLRTRYAVSVGVGSLAAACGVALTATSGWLIVRASQQPPVLTLMVAIVGVRAFGLGRPVFRYAERLVSHDAALRSLARLRVAAYEALVPLTPGGLGRRRGDLLGSVVDDVDSLVERKLRVWMPLCTSVVVGVVAAVSLSFVLPGAAVVTGALVMFALALFGVVALGSRRVEASIVSARAALSGRVSDLLDGAGDTAVWMPPAAVTATVAGPASRLARAWVRSADTVAAARALLTVSISVAVAGAAAFASASVADGGLSPAVAALVVLLPLALGEVLGPLPDAGALEPRTRLALDRLHQLTLARPVVTDPAVAQPLPDADAPLDVAGLSAGWNGAAVVAGLDFVGQAGRRIAVTGPSGSGKSTIAAVIARHIDPLAGSVSVGGTDLRDARLDDVRAHIGFVDDDPHVFGSTLFENLRLACPEASRAELWEVLRRVRLDGWAAGLPHGLDTWIGDGAAGVSGGERARIALARAVLSDPAILVLDEPTSHLDAETAREVMADVSSATQRQTVVLVTHRMSEATTAHTVIALDDDRPLAAPAVPHHKP